MSFIILCTINFFSGNTVAALQGPVPQPPPPRAAVGEIMYHACVHTSVFNNNIIINCN